MNGKSKSILKSIIAFVMALAMVLGAVPLPFVPGSMVAQAEDDVLTEMPEAASGGTITLDKDVELASTWSVNTTVTLDLNGHGIRYTGDGLASVICVTENGNLTLKDSASSTTHYITLTNGRGTAVSDTKPESGTEGTDYITVIGGYITGGNCSPDNQSGRPNSGGGVLVDKGEFTMEAGTICGNTANTCGGGVYVKGNTEDSNYSRGKFTITGGTIKDNTVSYPGSYYAPYGGGVAVVQHATFMMSGGTIENNTASYSYTGTERSFGGGGVYVGNSKFMMSGGTIQNNTATKGDSSTGLGGGVCISTSEFTMTGGTISGNQAKQKGGGVYVADSKFNISGSPTISGNTKNGGSIANNVFLDYSSYESKKGIIAIAGALSNTTPIGVTLGDNYPNAFTSGWNTYMSSKTPNTYFKSEMADKVVGCNDESELEIQDPTYTLKVAALDFGNASYGYTQPEAQAITITSTGNSDATISNVALSGTSAENFTLNSSNASTSVTTGGTNETYTIQPNSGLAVGSYTATITVTYNDSATATENVSFTVTAKEVTNPTITVEDAIYTGNALEPAVTVKDGDTEIPSSEYTVSYLNNTNAALSTDTNAPTVTIADADGGNYNVSGSKTFTISKAAGPSLTDVNKPTANTLTYNGSNQELVTAPTTPHGSGYTLKYSTDSGSTWSETIPTGKNATDYTVKAKYFGDGNHADSAEMSVVVSIAPKPVTVDGITASDKTYDGTTTATLVTTGVTFTGIESGDTLTVSATGAFADANAGDSKNVTISGLTLGGASKDNYVLASSGNQATATAKINKKNVTVTAKAQTIEVNGSIVTDTTQVELTGKLSGHTLSAVTLTADSTSSVGAHTITPSEATIRDGDSKDVTGNYNITYADGTLTVTNVQVYISGVTVSNKTYDGGTSATITGTAVLKKVNGDEVVSGLTVSNITAAFADKNVGTGKSVTITGGTLSDSTNYMLVPSKTTGLTADITAKSVTITGLSAANKVYDGNTTATVKGTAVIDGKVSGDTVTVTAGSAAFENVNAGTGKTVTFSGYSLSGTDKDNYTLSAQPASVTANITKATPTITDVPTVGAITYGQQLSEVENSFSGGSVKLNGNDVNGTFVWSDGTLKPAVSDSNKTEYIVKFTPTDSSNLNDTTCKVKLTVNKADIADSAVNAPTAKTLTYTGSAQELIVAGSSTAGTMQYALGADAVTAPTTGWGTALPMGKNAGTHYVWYKIIGDANHNDKAPVKLEVAIAKATGLTKTADMTVEAQPGTNIETKVTLRQYLGDGVTLSSSSSGTTEGTITFSDISLGSGGELTFKTTSESGGKGHIELTVSSANYEGYKLTIPVEVKAKSTQVVFDEETGTDTSVIGVSSSNLSDFTEAQTDTSVKVVLDVEVKKEEGIDGTVKTKIESELDKVFSNVESTNVKKEFLDMKVTKSVNGGSAETVEDVGRVLEIEVSYDLTGKYNPVIIREHKGSVARFTELSTKPTGSYKDGTFSVDRTKNKIYIYTEFFSTYSIAYADTPSYQVTFDNDGTKTQVVVKSGGKVTKPTDPTKSGYIFNGWYNGSTAWNFDNDTVSSDLTLTAKWTQNGGGSGSGGSGNGGDSGSGGNGGGSGGGTSAPTKTTPAKPAAPTLESKTDASITVKTAAGQVYSIDGGKNWQTSGTFTGLAPETEYSIVTKVSETSTSYESAVSDALKVTTDKKADPSTPTDKPDDTAAPGSTTSTTVQPGDTAAPDSTTTPTDQPSDTAIPATEPGGTSTPTNKPDDTAAPDSTTTPTDQPSETAIPDSTETPDTGKKPAAEGTVLVDAGKTAYYAVTSADTKKPEVAYKQCRNKKAKKVTIPQTVKIGGVTYTVTSIAANAFKNHKTITKVAMGKNIRTIGKNAFYGCKKLKTVTIGKNVTKIGAGAFSGCKKLVVVKMGSKVSVIGAKAFYNCASLKSITLPKTVKKIGKKAFSGCGKLKKITVKTKKLTLKNVGKNAFSGIYIRASVLVPGDKRKEYALLFRKRGAGKKIRIKKI